MSDSESQTKRDRRSRDEDSYRRRDDDRRDRREEDDRRERHRRSTSRERERERERDRDRAREREMEEARREERRERVPEKPREAAPVRPAIGGAPGAYIPPHRLAAMKLASTDKSSEQYQKMSWEALKKSINGLINKVNVANIKNIIPELFKENLIRGRGLFIRSVMKAQAAAHAYTHIYAALVAVVNTKMPEIGELLVKRVIMQFKRAFKRNDKPVCISVVKFIAHLVNQLVAHELLALELATLLLEKPTDDSVEMAVDFIKECGAALSDISSAGLQAIFERFRGILHEGEIDKRVQYMIEELFAVRKVNFSQYPRVVSELDLVEEQDQITHELTLDETYNIEDNLDYFRKDPDFEENEHKYEAIRREVLGELSSSDEEDNEEGGDADEESSEDDEEIAKQQAIIDQSEQDVIALRKIIYLTIMSSVSYEECAHKLLKNGVKPGQEIEICTMILECCSQERTYLKFYGLLGSRFCLIDKVYAELFDNCFMKQYANIHRLETNKLRNVSRFFAHLLYQDAMDWSCLEYIRLTETDTTSSSRIFIKILFQELAEHMGLTKLNTRLSDPYMKQHFDGIFPTDNPKNTRFAINFFTSIGLGGLTDGLREHLAKMPKLIMEQQAQKAAMALSSSSSDTSSSDTSSTSSSDSSSSDSSSSSSSSSSSEDEKRRKRRKH